MFESLPTTLGSGDLFEAKELQKGLTALGIRELIDNLARRCVFPQQRSDQKMLELS